MIKMLTVGDENSFCLGTQHSLFSTIFKGDISRVLENDSE